MHANLLFLDFEASSLGPDSYPIELGWASRTGSGAFLIRPEPEWTDWSPVAEQVHGIPRVRLFTEGIPATEAAARFLALASGHILVSDAPPFDLTWLAELLALTDLPRRDWPRIADNVDVEWVETARLLNGVPPRGTSVQTERLRCLQAGNLARKDFPGPRHRAEADAQRVLCGYLAVAEAVTKVLEGWEAAGRDG